MEAIASEGLAIGLELSKHALILVAALSLLGLREGRGVELGINLPSFSLKLKLWPREVPENRATPARGGTDDDLESRSARAKMNCTKDLDDQQQVDLAKTKEQR